MFPNNDNNNETLKVILLENQRLLIENNQMLHSMRRASFLAAIFRLVWILLVIGVSWYAYYEYIEPNVSLMQSKMEKLDELTNDSSQMRTWYEAAREKVGF